jgi:hypothetical protein
MHTVPSGSTNPFSYLLLAIRSIPIELERAEVSVIVRDLDTLQRGA